MSEEAGWERTLMDAVAPLGLPCAQLSYGGNASDYFVFQAESVPADYGDDFPAHERLLIQLHLFTTMERNTSQAVKKIKRAIHEAGFTYPSVMHAGPGNEKESDGRGQHIVFEFEGAQLSEASP